MWVIFYIKWIVSILVLLGVAGVFVWKKPFINFRGGSVELLPGVDDYPAKLLREIQKRRKQLGEDYRPRTRHLDSGGRALFTNRLFLEQSPYLLQHAHNPVNWYSWGEEAFEQARRKNLPVLLSVGYSTCHWCHVMEEESFEDLEIARYLNTHYVAIKVDREERPDIDAVYMSTVQLMTGRGGWPMTVWLTADKKPFYGGTYFPPRVGDRGSRIGFLSLLKTFSQTYHEKSSDILQQGDQIQQMVQRMLAPVADGSGGIPSKDVFHKLYQQMEGRWDRSYGGLSGAPKFPSSFPTRFLLRSYLKTKNKGMLQAMRATLDGMQRGGIRDHVGGGFHRYSVDEKWLVPHFEKMLYDQALLALAYLEAYHLLGEKSYQETASGILDYVRRDMQAKEGGFYSATDADSLKLSGSADHGKKKGEREEGYYFTWKPEEIDRVLTVEQAKLVKRYYGVTDQGHVEGRSILHTSESLAESAKSVGVLLSEAEQQLKQARQKLFTTRNLRPLPLRDEKVLTAWNGLMISAFVKGFLVLGQREYLGQAEKSAEFIWDQLYQKGELKRSWKDGRAYIAAYLDDYAFFISALLDLFEASGRLHWLKRAMQLDQILERDFEDKKQGGFFMTAHHYESLIAREKPVYDGAEPSGNAIAVFNLLRLGHLTGKKTYRQRAEKAIGASGNALSSHPISFSEWMQALDFYHSRVYEVVVILPDRVKRGEDVLFQEIRKWYLPNSVLVVAHDSEVKEYQDLLLPIKGKKAMKDRSTVYICEEGACQLPTSDVGTLREQLKDVQSAGYL